MKEAPQRAVFSWGLSLRACAQVSQITSLSVPTAQPAPTLERFSGTFRALPSHPSGLGCIPVSHSANKPRGGRRGNRSGKRGGWKQTWPCLLPAACSPSAPLPGRHGPPQESSRLSIWSACTMGLLCDLGKDPYPLWASGENNLEGHELLRGLSVPNEARNGRKVYLVSLSQFPYF